MGKSLGKIQLLLFCFFVMGQVTFAQDLVRGKVIDQSNQEPLPFATLYTNQSYGTTSDEGGNFEIRLQKGDVLNISYVGYKTQKFNYEGQSSITIKLKPLTLEIETIEISEKSDFLYKLLAKTRFSLGQRSLTSKAYLRTECFIEKEKVEQFEAYFNGTIRGYDVEKLDLKNGRIGLQPYRNRYFLNINSSEAVIKQKLLDNPYFFPENPLGMGKGELKKKFELSFEGKFNNEDSAVVYQIDFKPLGKCQGFEGTVWLDSSRAAIVKVEYLKKKTKNTPFLPLIDDGSILYADLYIRKQFKRIGKWYYLNTTDFQYDITYQSRKGELQNISTNAVLSTYDYKNEFYLPKFAFPKDLRNDYRKLVALPFNAKFWNDPKRFQLIDEQGEYQAFFNHPRTVRAGGAFITNSNNKQIGLFEHPYVLWSGQRILLRDEPDAYRGFNVIPPGIVLDELYNLEAQLFLDVNKSGDSLYCQTAAIFDPFESFYKLKHDTASAVFINLYFDLAEVHRRKLEENLKGKQDLKVIEYVYEKQKKEFEEAAKLYFEEVKIGRDAAAIKSWNNEIRNELGIDNMKLFYPSLQ